MRNRSRESKYRRFPAVRPAFFARTKKYRRAVIDLFVCWRRSVDRIPPSGFAMRLSRYFRTLENGRPLVAGVRNRQRNCANIYSPRTKRGIKKRETRIYIVLRIEYARCGGDGRVLACCGVSAASILHSLFTRICFLECRIARARACVCVGARVVILCYNLFCPHRFMRAHRQQRVMKKYSVYAR